MVGLYYGMLLSNKKEWSTDMGYNWNEPWKQYWVKSTSHKCVIPFVWKSRISKLIQTESRFVVAMLSGGWSWWVEGRGVGTGFLFGVT